MIELMTLLFVFAASFIVGYFLISRVPPLLHTPLMSMTNAISAVTILGAVLIFSVELGFYQKVLGVTAVIMATFNVVGGFVITDRMLKLFKKKAHTE
jgi:H+-translocating NAD(P) transhydrogenase subunit alpha